MRKVNTEILPADLISLILHFTNLSDYPNIILICKVFLECAQGAEYWQRILKLNYPEYLTQSQFDPYFEKKIDYKEIFHILSNFKKHLSAPSKIPFKLTSDLLAQFFQQTDHKVVETSPWVIYLNGYAAKLAGKHELALTLYEQATGKPDDKYCVAAAAINLSNIYDQGGLITYGNDSKQYAILEAAFNKTKAAMIAYKLGQNFEILFNHGGDSKEVDRETAAQWYKQALAYHSGLKIEQINSVTRSLVNLLSQSYTPKEIFNLLRAYHQYDQIILRWEGFRENKIVDIDQKQMYEQWKVQLNQTKNPIAAYNLVLFYCQFFGNPSSFFQSAIEFELSREQVLSHAQECVAMLPNASLQSNLRAEIQMLTLRFDQRKARLLEEKYKENPNVKTALKLGALYEQRYLSPNQAPMIKQGNCRSTAYWYLKALDCMSLDERMSFTSEPYELKPGITIDVELFLSEHPLEAEQARAQLEDEQQVASEALEETQETDDITDDTAGTAYNRYRLTGQPSSTPTPPTSPSPPPGPRT